MAFKTPENLRYTTSHEWLLLEDDVATLGITDYAQDSLGDVVYIELPQVGDTFSVGSVFGTVESVKAASDLFVPLNGEVVAVNTDLEAAPETINQDPYGAAWMIKLKVAGDLPELLDAAAYAAHAESEH